MVDRGPDQLGRFRRYRRFDRRRFRRRQFLPLIVDQGHRSRTAPPKGRPAVVRGDREQPRAERFRKSIGLPVDPHAQEDFLEEFLTAMVVARHAFQVRQQRAGVAPDEYGQALTLPLRRLHHEPFVGLLRLVHTPLRG